jgi:hypothetical protein
MRMTDPRDAIDDWLGTDVAPLSPPPGALDRIRRRARQRKVRQVVIASAGCAVVLAAAVTVPQLLPGGQSGAERPAAAADSAPLTRPPAASPGNSTGPTAPQGSGTQLQQRTSLSTTTSGTIPPPHFRPTSVTFVGTGSGTVVGAVIGQAGPPCATSYCTSLAGTSNYGASWYGVSAPVAPGPDGGSGVSQLRFANLRDGWAFGPGLYETSGGGWPWTQEDTYGQRVLDVEAAAGHALAIFGTCTGTGADYAANCTSFTLYSSAAGSTTWTPVQVPAAFAPINASTAPSLVIAGNTGYLVAPSGAVITGPVTGGPWTLAGQAPCKPAGLPSGGFLLAASPVQLLLTCASPPASSSQPVLFTSPNGLAWQQVGPVQAAGTPTSLASAASGEVVLATTAGIAVSADAGKTWRSASIAGSTPAGGFAYVGMTNAEQGVAVPADSSLGELFVTQDGGLTWTPSPIKG